MNEQEQLVHFEATFKGMSVKLQKQVFCELINASETNEQLYNNVANCFKASMLNKGYSAGGHPPNA